MKKCIICDKELTQTQVKYCSPSCKQKGHYKKNKTNTNTTYSQFKRGYTKKLQLLKLKGGCCSKCGYSANLAALHFHHLKDKSFPLDIRMISNTNIKKLLVELEKCIILCANCHSELHNPHLFIDQL